jgi:hypothetical protein
MNSQTKAGAFASCLQASLNVLGVGCLAANLAIEIARLVLTQFIMQKHDVHAWQSMKLMTGPATCTLAVMMISELPSMMEMRAGRCHCSMC